MTHFAWRAPRRAAASPQQGITTLGKLIAKPFQPPMVAAREGLWLEQFPRFFESLRSRFQLCSKSMGGAREAMTVGCKPTSDSPNQVLTHAARAAAKQPLQSSHSVAARGAREGPWSGQYKRCAGKKILDCMTSTMDTC